MVKKSAVFSRIFFRTVGTSRTAGQCPVTVDTGGVFGFACLFGGFGIKAVFMRDKTFHITRIRVSISRQRYILFAGKYILNLPDINGMCAALVCHDYLTEIVNYIKSKDVFRSASVVLDVDPL